ncbi:hypothetical protein LCGC14_2447860, partial [marine sediment metagenome]
TLQTVKNHMTSIMTKTGGFDRTHAVIIALEKGWIKQVEKEDELVEIVHTHILSRRQVECLQLISLGMIYKEIAYKLDIKEGTVKTHLALVYNKLEVNHAAHAVGEGIRRGIIE